MYAFEYRAVSVHILLLVREVLANLVLELSLEDLGTVKVDVVVLRHLHHSLFMVHMVKYDRCPLMIAIVFILPLGVNGCRTMNGKNWILDHASLGAFVLYLISNLRSLGSTVNHAGIVICGGLVTCIG